MKVDSQTGLIHEIAGLVTAIDHAAVATEVTLSEPLPGAETDDPRSPLAERKELCRQLAALRHRVAAAQSEIGDRRALRAELATLLFFAGTLQADAKTWRAALQERINELERQKAAERRERERLAARWADLVRRRDALRLAIAQTSAQMAQQNGGECRRTLPVFTLGEGLTVCSVSVFWPRRRLRGAERWLVTLNRPRDGVLVRRE